MNVSCIVVEMSPLWTSSPVVSPLPPTNPNMEEEVAGAKDYEEGTFI